MGRLRRAAIVVLLFQCLAHMPAAHADTPSCGPGAGEHCYSTLEAYGTKFYGMYGTWNRAWLAAGSPTVSNHRFINSEMWLSQSRTGTAPWVEVGLKAGYFAGTTSVGNRVFGEWYRAGNVGFHNFGTVGFSDRTTDEYQVSRAGVTNSWRVYWNGALWTTGSGPGFWSSTDQLMGGEVATSLGKAHLFTMHGKGITSSGSKVNFATDVAFDGNDTPAGSGSSDLYGSRPADSTWKWRVPE